MVLLAERQSERLTQTQISAFRRGLERRLGVTVAERLQADVSLARYTAARVGGPADALLEVRSAEELALAVEALWALDLPFLVLGGGSNVLVSDAGVLGVVLVNRARQVRFDENAEPPYLWAESGANFGLLARQAALHGLGGLAWAAGIPGTLGGAVVGNAGAHGADMASNLLAAEVLVRQADAPPQRVSWTTEQLDFAYRTSRLKRQPGQVVVLSAMLGLNHSSTAAVQAEMDRYLEHRRRTQPPGASMGSMFKNPPGDYAGRLIEAAGLKGERRGQAQISKLHANFFVNLGQARAQDVWELIQLARRTVAERFGVELALEVQLLGDWQEAGRQPGLDEEKYDK